MYVSVEGQRRYCQRVVDIQPPRYNFSDIIIVAGSAGSELLVLTTVLDSASVIAVGGEADLLRLQ